MKVHAWVRQLTYCGYDEDDEESVDHGHEGVRKGGEDFCHGRQLAEDTQHAAAAPEKDEADRHAGHCHTDKRKGYNEHIKHAPAVGEERSGPVGEAVEDELGSEGEGEEHVDLGKGSLLGAA